MTKVIQNTYIIIAFLQESTQVTHIIEKIKMWRGTTIGHWPFEAGYIMKQK